MKNFPGNHLLPTMFSSHLSLVLGRASCPPRGIGGEATKRSYRGLTSGPMLAKTRKPTPLNITKTLSTGSNKGKKINNPPPNIDLNLPKILRPLPIIFFASFLLCATSCSSQQHKKTSLNNLLNAEETLLRSIEAERSTKSVKQRLERDQTLLEAEWHLREAIRAMFDANQAVRKAIR